MKKLDLVSIALGILTILFVAYSFFFGAKHEDKVVVNTMEKVVRTPQSDSLIQAHFSVKDSLASSQIENLRRLMFRSVHSGEKGGSGGDSEPKENPMLQNKQLELMLDSFENMKRKNQALEKAILSDISNEDKLISTKSETIQLTNNQQSFWVKVIFTGVFLLAALYVILIGKYNDETRKWAFGVLALIAGVWIGTASS